MSAFTGRSSAIGSARPRSTATSAASTATPRAPQSALRPGADEAGSVQLRVLDSLKAFPFLRGSYKQLSQHADRSAFAI
jgi:hypothetical protein